MESGIDSINSRVISRFVSFGASGSSHHDLALIFVALLSLSDESIALTNDRSDLLGKSWADLQRALSNNGKVVCEL